MCACVLAYAWSHTQSRSRSLSPSLSLSLSLSLSRHLSLSLSLPRSISHARSLSSRSLSRLLSADVQYSWLDLIHQAMLIVVIDHEIDDLYFDNFKKTEGQSVLASSSIILAELFGGFLMPIVFAISAPNFDFYWAAIPLILVVFVFFAIQYGYISPIVKAGNVPRLYTSDLHSLLKLATAGCQDAGLMISSAITCSADYNTVKTDEGSKAYFYCGCLASLPNNTTEVRQATWPAGYAIGALTLVFAFVALLDTFYYSILPTWRGEKLPYTKTSVQVRAISYTNFVCYGVSFISVGAMPPPGVPQMQAVEYLIIGIINVALVVLMWTTKRQSHGFATRYFEKERALGDGVLIASLLETGAPAVHDTWWLHDDAAYDATPPRAKVWYRGTVTQSNDAQFEVVCDEFEAVPADSSIQRLTTVESPSITDPDVLVKLATESLYCICCSDITEELMVRSPRDNPMPTVGGRNTLARRCSPGEIDWFISHSWNDDPLEKWKVLQDEARNFKREKGRWPLVWLDKVCLSQENVGQSLKCLPIYLLACKGVLVLGGETYISRLWCIWELYTRFVVSDSTPNVVIREFEDGAEHRAARANVAIPMVADEGHLPFRTQIEHFNLGIDTRCYDPNEEAKILAAIRASPGGEGAFNAVVHKLAPLLEVSKRNKTTLGAWFGSAFGGHKKNKPQPATKDDLGDAVGNVRAELLDVKRDLLSANATMMSQMMTFFEEKLTEILGSPAAAPAAHAHAAAAAAESAGKIDEATAPNLASDATDAASARQRCGSDNDTASRVGPIIHRSIPTHRLSPISVGASIPISPHHSTFSSRTAATNNDRRYNHLGQLKSRETNLGNATSANKTTGNSGNGSVGQGIGALPVEERAVVANVDSWVADQDAAPEALQAANIAAPVRPTAANRPRQQISGGAVA